MKTLLIFSSFDSRITTLELNTRDSTTFVVKRMDTDQLKKYFGGMNFFAGLKDIDLINIKKPLEVELSNYNKGRSNVSIKRFEDI